MAPGAAPSVVSEVIAWLNLAATVGLTLFIFFARRYQATREQIAQLEQYVGDEVRSIHARVSTEIRTLDNRVTRIEEWRTQVPGTADVEKLYTELETVRGDIKEIKSGMKSISESVTGVRRQVGVINDYLLQRDKVSRTKRGNA